MPSPKTKKKEHSKLLRRPQTSLGFVSKTEDFVNENREVTRIKSYRRSKSVTEKNAHFPSPSNITRPKTSAPGHRSTSSNFARGSDPYNKEHVVKRKKKQRIIVENTRTIVKNDSNTHSLSLNATNKVEKVQHDNSVDAKQHNDSGVTVNLHGDSAVRENIHGVRFLDIVPEIPENVDDSEIRQDNTKDGMQDKSCTANTQENASWDTLVEQVMEDEGGYDTDIELEFKEKRIDYHDLTGKMVYMRLCKDNELVPVSYFVNRMDNTSFTMRHHGLGSQGGKTIAQALIKNTIVEKLDLTDNFLEPEGGLAFAEMLHENFFISDLDLSDNFLHARTGVAFANVLLVNTSLKRLVLQGNHFTDKVAKAFAEALKENRTLKHLDLSYNEFGEVGGLFLGAGLALNYGLKSLNLRWNSIRGKGAASMAAALKSNDSLKSLDLSWNGISFIGALALHRHLRKNEALHDLDISNNRIGPKGAVKLALAVKRHPALQTLKIGLNPIGDEGVEALLSAVKINMNVKLLGLDDITVSPRVFEEILALEKSRDIIITTGGLGGFSQRKPPPSGMEILVQFMQDNRLRLKDLFFQFDKDHSGDITRDEFKVGLKETGIKMSDRQLDALIESIDIDKNNLIDYSEVLHGREVVRRERRFQKKVAVRTEQREKESIELPKLKGFEE